MSPTPSKQHGSAPKQTPPPGVTFSADEIHAAIGIKPHLDPLWQPSVGHFVYDAANLVDKPSPFQDNVYFVLNHEYFMTLIGGVESFRQQMVWLPTWEQLRTVASRLEIDHPAIIEHCFTPESTETHTERQRLYRLVAETCGVDLDG